MIAAGPGPVERGHGKKCLEGCTAYSQGPASRHRPQRHAIACTPITIEPTGSGRGRLGANVAIVENRAPAQVKRLPRETRERQILDAAVQVFSAAGYHSASMDDISGVAGISKPMIYAYLGTKEDLFAACIRRESVRLVEAVIAGAAPDLPPDVQLWHGLRAFFTFVGRNQNGWRVLHRQARAEGGPFTEQVDAIRERAITTIVALLINAARGVDVDDVGETALQSGEMLAAALVGAGESLADWWLDHQEESIDLLAVRLMNLVWTGFGSLLTGRVWTPPQADTRRAFGQA